MQADDKEPPLRPLLRFLILVPSAYVSACIAAGLTVLVGVGGPDEPEFGSIVVEATLGIAAYTLVLTFLPMAVAIVAAELFVWRSAFVWLLVGAAIGLFALVGIGQFTPGITEARPELYLAAGGVFGVVYWLIAGRLSGTSAAPCMRPIEWTRSDSSRCNERRERAGRTSC